MEQATRKKLNKEAAARLELLRIYLENDNSIAQGRMTIAEYMNFDAALTYAIAELKKEENK